MKTKEKKSRNKKNTYSARMLGLKDKIDKKFIDQMASLDINLEKITSAEEMVDQIESTPPEALLIDTSKCDSLHQLLVDENQALNQWKGIIIISYAPNELEKASQWAHTLSAFMKSSSVSAEELAAIVYKTEEAIQAKQKISAFIVDDPSVGQFGFMVAKSLEMKEVFRLARILSGRGDSILFVGGPGTGKELLARTIHEYSPRRHGPFFAVNCSMFSENDLAFELFGQGDPNTSDERSLIEMSDGGILFLDDIGVTSPSVQAKLQQLLENGTFTRMHSRTPCKADVRLFASTSTPLLDLVDNGDFSEELYFRLNRFTLQLPSLNRRLEDISVLVKVILAGLCKDKKNPPQITNEAFNALQNYHWPGNIRELVNVLEFASLVAGESPIQARHLPKQFQNEVGSIFVGTHVDELPPFREIERRYILRVMEAVKGNKVKAAEILDVNRATLHRKLQIYSQNNKEDIYSE